MNQRTHRKKSTLILAAVALLILVLGVLQLTLRLIFADRTLTAWTVRVVEERLGLEATLQDVQLNVVPYPAVHILNLTVKDPATGVPWIRGESLEIALRWRPMLRGRFLPRGVVLRSPRIRIEKTKRNTWKVLGRTLSGQDRSGSGALAALTAVSVPGVSIHNGSVEMFDLSRPGAAPRLVLQDVDATVRQRTAAAPVQLEMEGQFPHKFLERNSFSLRARILPPDATAQETQPRGEADLSVSNLPPEVSAPMLREFLGAQLLAGPIDLTAHLSVKEAPDFDLSGELRLHDFRIALPRHYSEPLSGTSALLNYDLSREDAVVSVKHADLTLDTMSLWGEGIWTADLNGTPWYAVSLHGSNLALADIRTYLPDKIAQAEILRHLRGAASSGSFDIPLLEVTDTLVGVGGEPVSPRTVSMKILFHDFALRPGAALVPMEKVNGLLAFEAGVLRFEDLQGRLGRSLIRRLHGTVGWGGNGPMDLRTNARLHLPEIQALLQQVPPSLRTTSLLDGVEASGGYVELDGRLATPNLTQQAPSIEGSATLLQAGFRLPLWNTMLSNIQGRLSFRGDRVLPFTLKANVHAIPVSIGGKVAGLLDAAPSLNLTLSGAPSEKDWLSWVPGLEGKLILGGAAPQLSMHLLGTPQALRIESSLDLSQASVKLSNWLDKPRGVKSRLHLVAQYQRGEDLRISEAAWETEGATLSASGNLGHGPEPILNLTAHSDHLLLAPFARMLPKISAETPKANVKGQITASHAIGRKGSLALNGRLTLTGVGFHPAFQVKGIRNVAGTLYFKGRGIEARGLRAQWGDDPATVDFKLADLRKPEPDFTIRTPFVDVKELFKSLAATNETARSDTARGQFRDARAQGEIIAARARYAPFDMQDLRATIDLADGVLRIPTCSTRALDGLQKGRGELTFDSSGGAHFQATADITNVDAEKYLHLFEHNRTFYPGRITGSISVAGTLAADLRETARKMTGDAHLRIRHLQERSNLEALLLGVRERLAIISGQRDALYRILAFDEMGGDFTLGNGRFYSNNFYIHQYHKFDVSGFTLDKLTAAVPMRVKYNVQAAGSWDFLDSRIDCYVIARPFAATSKLVEKVPLAGKILTGADESLYSQSFHFEGFTSHEYRGTAKGAQLKRTAFEDLPASIQQDLKGP